MLYQRDEQMTKFLDEFPGQMETERNALELARRNVVVRGRASAPGGLSSTPSPRALAHAPLPQSSDFAGAHFPGH